MTKPPLASIGWSAQTNPALAGESAAHNALQGLGGRPPCGAIVFGSSWFDQVKLIEGVRNVLQSIPVVGGSTAGELTPEGPKTHSCVVLALGYDDDVTVSWGAGTGLERHPRTAGHDAALQAMQQFPGRQRSGFIFFGDGLLPGYADVVQGVQEVLGTSSLVAGGLMGDDWRFATTYQYADDRVLTRAVSGLLLGGLCTIGVGVEHGFAPISRPLRVTKAYRSVLYELDGKPAASVYEDYFGPAVMATVRHGGLSRELICYPLGIQRDGGGHLLRNVMGFGRDGSLECIGEVAEGMVVQLMIGSKEVALEAATLAAQQAVRSLQSVWFVLVFDSVVRQRLLGQDTVTEFQRLRDVIGPSVPLLGCSTYGEQAPFSSPSIGGRSSVQSGAILVIAVGT